MKKSFFLIILLVFYSFVQDVVSSETNHNNEKKGTDGRIVGGYNTTIQDMPYQVFLLMQLGTDIYQCGGSILNERYILTAAHCIIGATRIFVRAGSTLADSGGTLYNTTKFRPHPLFRLNKPEYDVGVINIPSGMILDGRNTRAVKLASAGTTIEPGTNILVAGWGLTENGKTSENLMAVQVPTISNTECRKSYYELTSRQFCAGIPEGGKDACKGDSGGAAVATDSGLQIGIVSFGIGCELPEYPGVYVNVAKVRRWIKYHTGV